MWISGATGISETGIAGDGRGAKRAFCLWAYIFARSIQPGFVCGKIVNAVTAAYKGCRLRGRQALRQVADYGPRIDITFKIDEGEQTKVKSLNFDNDRAQPGKGIIGNRRLQYYCGRTVFHRLSWAGPQSRPGRYEDQRLRERAVSIQRGIRRRESPSCRRNVFRRGGNAGKSWQRGHHRSKDTQPHFCISEITDSKVTEGEAAEPGEFADFGKRPLQPGHFRLGERQAAGAAGQGDGTRKVLIKVHESPRNSIDLGSGISSSAKQNIPVGTVALPGIPPIGVGSKIHGQPEQLLGTARVAAICAAQFVRGRVRRPTSVGLGRRYAAGSAGRLLTYGEPAAARLVLEFAV